MELLGDGKHHTKEEILNCLPDTMGSTNNISPHLTMLRKMLRCKGEDIVNQPVGKSARYILVRLMPSAYNGKS